MKLVFSFFAFFCGFAFAQSDGSNVAGADAAGTDSAGSDAAGSDGTAGTVEISMTEVNDCDPQNPAHKFEATGLICRPERILLEVPYCAFKNAHFSVDKVFVGAAEDTTCIG